MKKIAGFVYGLFAYMLFFGWFLYAIGFFGNFIVPKSIDSGAAGPIHEALLVGLLPVVAFAVQHTIMARIGFKLWWTRFIPKALERSTFVMVASLLMWLMIWQWRPMPRVIWSISHPLGSAVLVGVSLVGWFIVLLGSFMINHFELFGLQQVYVYLRGREFSPPSFKLRGFYKIVRHPLMLGFLIAFWATPQMTVGHMFLAAAFTVYILIGITFEERDLLRHHGKAYEQYRREVPMLIPFTKKR